MTVSLPCHFRSTFWTGLVEATLSSYMRFLVTTLWTDAVPTRTRTGLVPSASSLPPACSTTQTSPSTSIALTSQYSVEHVHLLFHPNLHSRLHSCYEFTYYSMQAIHVIYNFSFQISHDRFVNRSNVSDYWTNAARLHTLIGTHTHAPA